MIWEYYTAFAISSIVLLLLAGLVILLKKEYKQLGDLFFGLGLASIVCFAVWLWIDLQRPPMRTMGETRLWYAICLNTIAFIFYKKWHYRWLPLYAAILGTVFLLMNIFKPEIQNKNLMPALQSPWFIPHVSVYIASYAFLGASFLMACVNLIKNKTQERLGNMMPEIDQLIYIGSGLLILGLLMGGIWAKQVWCHFWSWDPKETWAFVTLAAYMIYLHLRRTRPDLQKTCLYIVIFAFVCLMITWKGVNLLPSAKASMHTYF